MKDAEDGGLYYISDGSPKWKSRDGLQNHCEN